MALGRVSDLRKSSFLLSKGCAAFRGRGHRRHERHAEARPTCHLCSFSDSLLACACSFRHHCQSQIGLQLARESSVSPSAAGDNVRCTVTRQHPDP